MRFQFDPAPQTLRHDIVPHLWNDWSWQMRSALKTEADFAKVFRLAPEEAAGFRGGRRSGNQTVGGLAGKTGGFGPQSAGVPTTELKLFEVRTTPYYASLASADDAQDPIRRILMPREEELHRGTQSMLDPLGERRNSRTARIIHRYPDRVLFLVTDFCSVYCRYCTRKHFTGGEQSFASNDEYEESLQYIRRTPGIREVILSGGDPLTLSDSRLERVMTDLRAIEHVELIRVGSRMPVVCPMRITDDLVQILRPKRGGPPTYLMTHFNHPRELTAEAARGLEKVVEAGIPIFNQMVLLNGVNNAPEIVQALSRRLLFLRVKPYYMFQCDPSFGTDHLRTSIEESLEIQAALWGRISGLAMPTLSLDIPDGGGKASLVPEFEHRPERHGDREHGVTRVYEGWDGVRAEYRSPPAAQARRPVDAALYESEWRELCAAKTETRRASPEALLIGAET